MDQTLINKFFVDGADYTHRLREVSMIMYKKSGNRVRQKIDKNATILDVGCGKNLFKKYFPNLVGIDPVDPAADVLVALLDFKTDQQFDVILCLGSIFGNLDDIRKQIIHIKSMLKPGGKIFWRNHPAKPEWVTPERKRVKPFPDFMYQWTEDTHYQLAGELGFIINDLDRDPYLLNPLYSSDEYRIYAEWTLS